jgi:hypothetical protein
MQILLDRGIGLVVFGTGWIHMKTMVLNLYRNWSVFSNIMILKFFSYMDSRDYERYISSFIPFTNISTIYICSWQGVLDTT